MYENLDTNGNILYLWKINVKIRTQISKGKGVRIGNFPVDIL